jgi:hypothetical protein
LSIEAAKANPLATSMLDPREGFAVGAEETAASGGQAEIVLDALGSGSVGETAVERRVSFAPGGQPEDSSLSAHREE